jgi:hypothetical protein
MWIPVLLKKIADIVHGDTGTIQERLAEQERSARDRSEASKQQEREIGTIVAGAIETVSNTIPAYKYTKRDKEYSLQRKMLWVTFGGAVAASVAAGGAWYYAHIANQQLDRMADTYKEMRWQTYMGCLNARAAQETFIQVQRSAVDSHTATAAAVQQAAAQIESQRAVLQVSFRVPENGQFLAKIPTVKGPIDQLGTPGLLKNDGKTMAKFFMAFRGVLLSDTDKFVIKGTSRNSIKGFLPEGAQVPERKDPTSQYNPVTLMAPVEDVEGTPIPYGSEATQDFFHGTAEVMVYGILNYSDNWARHETTFCMPVFLMGQGTSRGASTPNEIKCANYNKDKTVYINRPEIQTPTTSSPVELIKCEVPKD